ncbi:ankyrin-3-like [Phymastichus coffea]|uniref:ankyrin-3-like n=1 Tax=Phymastichus coffea TaxID=108790 RepID=UPI00273CA9C4|nr:ankyrin-3-like [Phymastichus coffea]
MDSLYWKDDWFMAIKDNKVSKIHSTLTETGWPKDFEWLDYELLLTALTMDRVEVAHVLLDHNARPEKLFSKSMHAPLQVAVSKPTTALPDLIRKILKNGGNAILKRGVDRQSSIHVAFNKGAPGEVIDLLFRSVTLKSKADWGDIYGLTFLHIACTRPNLNIVKMFFDVRKKDYQVKICGYNYAGFTALHFAVYSGMYENAKFLIDNGSNIYQRDYNESNPIHLSLIRRNVHLIDLLVAHDKQRINIVNKFGVSHFMVACAGSRKNFLEEYLEAATDDSYDMISAKVTEVGDCQHYTPLHFAVDAGQADNVKFLIQEGADCCSEAADHSTPHTLAHKRDYKIIGEILQRHCNIVKKCKQSRSQDPDFNQWGDNYERKVLIKLVREFTQLDQTLEHLITINQH